MFSSPNQHFRSCIFLEQSHGRKRSKDTNNLKTNLNPLKELGASAQSVGALYQF